MNIVYLNDQFLPLEKAKISVLDRGFLFADGVYEVIPVYGARPFRLNQHLQRLQDSLDGIRLQNPFSEAKWSQVIEELIVKNKGGEQSLYLQVTRGVHAKRDHPFPEKLAPTIFIMSSPLKSPPQQMLNQGASVIILPDIRWQHCHLKTIALLPNVLLRQAADDQQMDEAILIRDGFATECTTANLFMVKQGEIITPPKSADLLPGITRDLILELAEADGLSWREECIAEKRLQSADEIWISSSTREVVSVTSLNGKPVGLGKPGPLWNRMAGLYKAYKHKLIEGEAG